MTRNEMNGRTAAEQTINGKNGDGRFVGYAVGANCFSGISQTRARAEAEDLGIADDLIFPRLKSANYYRRAVVAAVSAGRTDERKFTAVKVEDTTKRIVHAIIRKDIVSGLIGTGAIVADASGELRINSNDAIFGEEFKVQFDKEAFEKGKQPEDLVTYEDRAKEHPVATAIGSLY